MQWISAWLDGKTADFYKAPCLFLFFSGPMLPMFCPKAAYLYRHSARRSHFSMKKWEKKELQQAPVGPTIHAVVEAPVMG